MGALAAVLALLAVTFIALGAIGLANVATPNMQGFNPGATVTVTNAGMSVYARSDDDRASTVCTADDGSATTLARPTSEFSIDVAGSDFYEVARTSDDLAAGSYALTCRGTEQALYVGPAAPNTSASGLMGPVGLVGGIVLGFLALVLMVTALVIGRTRGNHGLPSEAGHGGPYAGTPPPPWPYDAQNSQTTAFPEQRRVNPAYAPPPAPGWGSTSGEPTQAINYGQRIDQPTEGPTPRESEDQISGERRNGPDQCRPADERQNAQHPGSGDALASGPQHSNDEPHSPDQPGRYPPPPPPQ